MSKSLIKNLGMAVAPNLMTQLLSARSQRLIMRIERNSGCLHASQEFVAVYGRTVLRGPFAGMCYPKRSARERNLVHRLVGSYECELHSWIEEITQKRYPMIVDIGTADGFYAVGFAMRMPGARVIGFDTDPWARRATDALARENGVGNVNMKTMCTPAWMRDNVMPNSLIFSDCEGYEMALFDPKSVPNLTGSDMLIELHERASPGVEEAIRGRFAATHEIRIATYLDHDPAEFPELKTVAPEMRAAVISEGRGGPQNALFLTCRSYSSSSKD
ncbi:MAG: hypothetical protein AAGB13_01445 [Cyanobacteria bacterium P01_F01_bin.33]